MGVMVSRIQRFSLEDGPGIRTTVFFSGCNFRCVWCHNPESLAGHPILGIDSSLCDGCQRCLSFCPQHALSIVGSTITVDRKMCDNCGLCVPECYRGVFSLSGRLYDTDSLVDAIEEDLPYYIRSNGGVTFSGGEPLCQLEGLLAVLKSCREKGIHTILQTNLSLPFEQTIPYVDHYMVDLKIAADAKHQAWIGQGNSAVLRNIKELDRYNVSYEIRTPVVPQCNDTKDDILEIVKFLKQLKHLKRYRLLGYHPLGLPKYEQFGLPVQYDVRQGMDSSALKVLEQIVEKEMLL